MDLALRTGALLLLSFWIRFGPVSAGEGTLQYYSLEIHSVQLCVSSIAASLEKTRIELL